MIGRQAIGIDTFDRSTRVRHPDPVRFPECFHGTATVRFDAGRGGGGCDEEHEGRAGEEEDGGTTR